jgi:hypothetical protein
VPLGRHPTVFECGPDSVQITALSQLGRVRNAICRLKPFAAGRRLVDFWFAENRQSQLFINRTAQYAEKYLLGIEI